jgi:hypothetical protein
MVASGMYISNSPSTKRWKFHFRSTKSALFIDGPTSMPPRRRPYPSH